MIRPWNVIAAFCLAASTAGFSEAQLIPEDVKASMRAHVGEGARPGVILGVTQDGQTEFYAVGVARSGGEVSLSPGTVFEIGSVTKLFTAELLAALTVSGELSPKTQLSDIWPARLGEDRGVLGDLATHTAGLPRSIPDAALLSDDVEDLLSAFEMGEPLRDEPVYSNAGMAILAASLARHTGESYAELLMRALIQPYGLADTSYEPSDRARIAHPHIAGESILETRPETRAVARGAGGLYSTPQDLLRFVELHLDASDELTASIVHATLDGWEGRPLGWQVHEIPVRRIYHHGGDANGYQAFVGFRPDTRTGVVLLSNASADDSLQQVALHLLDHNVPLPSIESERPAVSDNQSYAGVFRVEGDDSGNTIVIRMTSNGLIYEEAGPDGETVRRARLVEAGPGVLQIRGAPIYLDFQSDAGGRVRMTAGDAQFWLVLRQ